MLRLKMTFIDFSSTAFLICSLNKNVFSKKWLKMSLTSVSKATMEQSLLMAKQDLVRHLLLQEVLKDMPIEGLFQGLYPIFLELWVAILLLLTR